MQFQITFFVLYLALGDEVETALKDAGKYLVSQVVKRSGHQTYWIWFSDLANEEIRNNVYERIKQTGCYLEGYSRKLLAFDAESSVQSTAALATLSNEIQQGILECVTNINEHP